MGALPPRRPPRASEPGGAGGRAPEGEPYATTGCVRVVSTALCAWARAWAPAAGGRDRRSGKQGAHAPRASRTRPRAGWHVRAAPVLGRAATARATCRCGAGWGAGARERTAGWLPRGAETGSVAAWHAQRVCASCQGCFCRSQSSGRGCTHRATPVLVSLTLRTPLARSLTRRSARACTHDALWRWCFDGRQSHRHETPTPPRVAARYGDSVVRSMRLV